MLALYLYFTMAALAAVAVLGLVGLAALASNLGWLRSAGSAQTAPTIQTGGWQAMLTSWRLQQLLTLAMTLVVALILLRLVFDFHLVDRYLDARSMQRGWRGDGPLSFWIPLNAVEFLLTLGPLLAALALIGGGRALGQLRHRRLPAAEATMATDKLLKRVIAGKYTIESVLGEGGMGAVYLAQHRLLDQQLVVKVMRPELAASEELYANAMHPYTTALLSAIPVADLDSKRKRIILEGDVPSPVNPPSGCPFHPRCPRAEARCSTEIPALRKFEIGGKAHYAACHFAEEQRS